MKRRLGHHAPVDALYPPDAAWMARTDKATTRLLGYNDVNIESVTGLLLGVLGRQPSVRHLSSVTTEILDFLSSSGLVIEEDMHVYRTGDEATKLARALNAAGFRFMSPYPVPAGLFPEAASVVPPSLWYRLNAKSRLSDLVEQKFLAPRRVIRPQSKIEAPVYLKAGGAAVTGWGYAVRFCESDAEIKEALDWFHDMGAEEDLVAEDAMSVETCWCTHVACSDGQTHYLGAAEQVFSAPARQSGSVIDAARGLPEAGRQIVLSAGEKARAFGFRGIAALDIGQTADGRLIVFDPNFRINASTAQVLFHDAAVAGTNWSVSQSAGGSSSLPMTEIISRLDGPVREGWFAPTRLLDAALLPATDGASLWTGFVLGADRAETIKRCAVLPEALAGEKT